MCSQIAKLKTKSEALTKFKRFWRFSIAIIRKKEEKSPDFYFMVQEGSQK
jgi:hypothetical protein